MWCHPWHNVTGLSDQWFIDTPPKSLAVFLFMPEIRECIAHFLCMLWFFQHCLDMNYDLHLLALWADATEKEAKKLAPDGHVYCLDASSSVYRGNTNSQTSLWPPTFRVTKSNPNPPSIQTLEWKGVSYSNRAIILNMGSLYFQVRGSHYLV